MSALSYNSKVKHLALAVVDAVLVSTAIILAVFLRYDFSIPAFMVSRLETILLPAVVIHLLVFFIFGFYRRVWRYAGIDEMLLIAVAITVALAGTYFSGTYLALLPRSAYMIAWFLLIFFIGGSRLSVRLLSGYLSNPVKAGKRKRALIVGAGEAGVLVARELKKHSNELALKVIGFIDDDSDKHKQIIQGFSVLGNREELPEIVRQKAVDEVIIAMPSASYRVMQEIVALCADLPVKIKTVPGIFEIIKGQVSLKALKDVDIEDLLRRPPVKLDMESISDYLAGQVVLVTGAGGSIGTELCRQIAQLVPDKLVLLDQDESGIFYTNLELSQKYPDLKVIPIVRDIQSRSSLEYVFKEYRPSVVFHAAAYKHVPLMELNAEEAVRNNVLGSQNLIDLASEYNTGRFVFVSTDKAVNPSSVMGVTKRVVEIYLQNKARNCSSCIYCAVRFGNVLGSQGSVVLLFRDQIARGGPITVTHPEMRRYFMTIPEAVQLVIQAGALGKGGEIFVLDMGEPIKIIDMARDMIILSGLKPDRDIKIEITGIRDGEKLFEELFSNRENFALTRHERIYIAPDTKMEKEDVKTELVELSGKINSSSIFDFTNI
jgi:FlaA1/EpsC-like NDP-sugar epimerase